MKICQSIRVIPAIILTWPLTNYGQPIPKLPIGMNIQGLAYWSPSPYLDPMKGSGDWFTFSPQSSAWNTEKIHHIQMRPDGYPTQIPQTVEGMPQLVRTMINNCRAGRYDLFFEGQGTLRWNGGASVTTQNGRTVVTLSGDCGHAWMDILSSQVENPIRNIRLVPVEYRDSASLPLFDPEFVRGLKPFHALRFMDWMVTNGSPQSTWDSRAKPTDRTFASDHGMPIEHAIQLANLLQAHAWFCVPHRADDHYIRKMAELVRDSLNPQLKVYVEFSNEIWNWGFAQAHFIGRNGIEIQGDREIFRAHDTIVQALRQVGSQFCGNPESYCHPEKDAYMMNRTFRIWKSVFDNADTSRLIRVAAVQHAWYDNTGRILRYLFEHGDGADAVSPAGYFSFRESDHIAWNAMNPSQVTPQMIIDSVHAGFESQTALWTRENARYARQYKVQYLVYEGGQHMQPYNQSDWGYNQAVWDAQIHPAMYDLYMRNFNLHTEDSVNCRLFMAFSYVGARESRYGSWGHLESYAQSALHGSALKAAAPKYAALLDANIPKKEPPTRTKRTLPIHRSTRAPQLFDLLGRYTH